MDFRLTDEQAALRLVTAEFVDREIMPYAAEWDRASTSTCRSWRSWPRLASSVSRFRRSTAESAATTCRTASRWRSSAGRLVGPGHRVGLARARGEDDRDLRYAGAEAGVAAAVVLGRALGCFGLTEPEHRVRRRVARRPGPSARADGWVLSGSKMFITNGTWAKVALVFARTGGPGPSGITAFLVPTDRAGLRPPGDHRASSDCAVRPPPSSPSTRSRCRTRPASARRAGLLASLCPLWTRAGCRSRPAASESARAVWTPR